MEEILNNYLLSTQEMTGARITSKTQNAGGTLGREHLWREWTDYIFGPDLRKVDSFLSILAD